MKKILIFIIAAMVPGCLSSCSEDRQDASGPLRMGIEAAPADITRSVLDETFEFENMVTSMTIAAFDNNTGYLVGSSYHQSGRTEINLPVGRTYRLCLLANMGDLTGRIPEKLSDMESFSYEIADYSGLKTDGLPMLGDTVSNWTPELKVNLRRLMAKLAITVDKKEIASMGGGGEDSFRNNRISVHNVARVIYPFAPGGSAARDAGDLFSLEEVEFDTFVDATATTSEELCLYVPENMQGAKAGPGPGLEGRELCTYVSFDGSKEGLTDGVYGDFIYRFFPGSADGHNLDLCGGKQYKVTLQLTWDRMFAEGDWKVEKSGWSDNRRIFLSLYPDRDYISRTSIRLARGSTGVPVYVFYSPQGNAYESEAAGKQPRHYEKGWEFYVDEPADGQMITGLVEHTPYRSEHFVTIPSATWSGYTNVITYATLDKREKASLYIETVEPVIEYSPSSMLFLFHEYGYDSRQTIRIDPASPVRPCNITVYTDDSDLITLGPFDNETGKVDVYWNDTNTSSAPKKAEIYLYSEACGVRAVCTVIQQNRPVLSVDEELPGDGDEIYY